MKISGKKTLFIIFLLLACLAGFFIIYVYLMKDKIADNLSPTNKVKAELLIFEGWLAHSLIDNAIEEFRSEGYKLIITTGIKSNKLDFCKIPMNGYLIFYPEAGLLDNEQVHPHKIDITAHSEMGGKYSSHFNFFINDSLIAEFIADEQVREYSIPWTGALREIDSLMVHFDDDYLDEGGDKNLYVKKITINNEVTIPYKYNSVYDIGRLGGSNRIINDYDSESEYTRVYFISSGIDSSEIVAVTGGKFRINKTIKSALAFKSWLETYNGKVSGINIISRGIHAKRTLLTYKCILGKSYEIGVISLANPAKKTNEINKFKEILAELINLLYYRIILLPISISN
jgi:hypothetical protein